MKAMPEVFPKEPVEVVFFLLLPSKCPGVASVLNPPTDEQIFYTLSFLRSLYLSSVSLVGFIEPLKDTGMGIKRELERIDFPVGHVACFAPVPPMIKSGIEEVILEWAVHNPSSV